MTAQEIRAEIDLIIDRLPEKALAVVLEGLKRIQSHSYDIDILKTIISENQELLRRLAD